MESSINSSSDNEEEKQKQSQIPSQVKDGCDPRSIAVHDEQKETQNEEDSDLSPEQKENLKEINEYKRMIDECKEKRDKYKELYFIDKGWMKIWKKVTGYKDRKLFGGKNIKREGSIPPIDNSVVYVKRDLYLRD